MSEPPEPRAPDEEDTTPTVPPDPALAPTRIESGGSTVAPTVLETGATPAAPTAARLERLGPYELGDELARGGMGAVYAARHPELDRRLAVKVLLAGALATPDERERFAIEARAAARLRHPHIVGIHTVGEEGGHAYLAMDLVDGGSLRARIRADGPLDPREAAALCAKVARALAHAHAQGVLHRDVKPANVLLDAAGEPLLTDFGLAKDVTDDAAGPTRSGQVMGTPAYMPPEQASGELERVDRRADIYALGATLYECLVGRPPFSGGSTLATLSAVLDRPPTPPRSLRPELDRDLETICLACLEKEPEARYGSASELADELDRYLAGEPIRARRPGPGERLAKWARRNPALTRVIAGAALLLLAVLVGGGAAHVRSLEAEQQKTLARKQEAEQRRDEARAEALRARVHELRAQAVLAAGRLDGAWSQRHAPPRVLLERVAGQLRQLAALRERAPAATPETPAADRSALADARARLAAVERSLRLLALTRLEAERQRRGVLLGLTPYRVLETPDGRTALSAFRHDVAFWDVATGTVRAAFETQARVESFALAPDGEAAATGDVLSDAVEVFQPGAPPRRLRGDWTELTALRFSDDGQVLFVAVARPRPTLLRWRRADWRPLPALEARGPVLALGPSRDGTHALTTEGSKGQRVVRLYRTADGELLRTVEAERIAAATRSADGAQLIVATAGRLLAGPLLRGELRAVGSYARAPVTHAGVTAAPARRAAVVLRRRGHVERHHDDAAIHIAALGREVALPEASPSAPCLPLPDGQAFVARCRDGRVARFDLASGARRATLVDAPVRHLALSADGRWLVAATAGDVRVVDLRGGAPQTVSPQPADGVAISGDGSRIALRRRDRVEVRERAAGTVVFTRTFQRFVRALALDAKGRRLLTGHPRRGLEVWDLETGRAALELKHPGLTLAALRPDGRAVFSAGRGASRLTHDSGARLATLRGLTPHSAWFGPAGELLTVDARRARLWSPAGDPLAELPGGDGDWSVSWSAKLALARSLGGLTAWPLPRPRAGQPLPLPGVVTPIAGLACSTRWRVAAHRDGLLVWDRTQPRAAPAQLADELGYPGDVSLRGDRAAVGSRRVSRLSLWDLRTERRVWRRETAARGVALSPGGRWVASGRVLTLFAARDGAPLQRLPAVAPFEVAFLPDASALVATTGRGSLLLLDRATGRVRRRHELRERPTACALDPEGRLAVTAWADGSLLRWDLHRPGQPELLARAPDGAFAALAWSPAGALLAAVATTPRRAGTLHLLDPQTGREVARAALPPQAASVAFTPEGDAVWVGARGELLRFPITPLRALDPWLPPGSSDTERLRAACARLRWQGSTADLDPQRVARLPR